MEKFLKNIYSFNEVEPVTLEEVKGGAGARGCCLINFDCNDNSDPDPDGED